MHKTAHLFLLGFLLFLLIPANGASALTVHADSDVPRARHLQSWADRSIMPTPETTIKVISWDDRCSSWVVAGCSLIGFSEENMMVIKSRGKYGMSYRYIFFHEVGHFFDYLYLTEENRRWISERLGMRAPWAKQGVERFADVYALCATTRQRRLRRRVKTFPLILGRPHAIIHVCRYTRLVFRRGMLAEPTTAPFEGYDG